MQVKKKICMNNIEHDGRVERIEGNRVFVRIEQLSACATCHARGACTTTDTSDKEIEAQSYGQEFIKGEQVKIVVQRSLGFKAVLLAYVVPFCIILISLFIFNSFISNELIVGTASLCTLLPYFMVLRVLNKQIETKFKFYVIKK